MSITHRSLLFHRVHMETQRQEAAHRKCCSLMPGSDHEIFLSLFGPYLFTFGINSGLERETGQSQSDPQPGYGSAGRRDKRNV